MYYNGQYLPTFDDIRLYPASIIMTTTQLPTKNTDNQYNIPLTLNTYPRFFVQLLLQVDYLNYSTTFKLNGCGVGNNNIQQTSESNWIIVSWIGITYNDYVLYYGMHKSTLQTLYTNSLHQKYFSINITTNNATPTSSKVIFGVW